MSRYLTAAAVVLVALLLAAPSAAAATEAGWRCTANASEANRTLLAAGSSGIPLPPAVPPEGPKVITGWKVEVGPGLAPISQRLEVFEIQNEKGEYMKVGESATETLVEGTNSFATRIPADEGDSVGLYGPVKTIFCEKQAGAISLRYDGNVATGETRVFKAESEVGTPLTVTVEADADNDGYGDETQDRCPKSAAYQGECPVVTLTATGKARKRSILVRVTASSEASVLVFGQVGWGFQSKRKPKAGKSKPTRLIVGLSGGTKTVLPGETARFTIPLPKAVLRRLGRIAPQESLKAKIAARATDLAGRLTTRRLTVRLKGREGA
ncbi:MAG TPA: hypothetical protein VNO20_05100 [Solirubrobacterales bacterium]|nr:hypothetical protein [Solirubrobacterales bacterium]